MDTYHDRVMRRVKEQQGQLDDERATKSRWRDAGKERRAFDKLPRQTDMDFWCAECEEDFKVPAWRDWIDFFGIGMWRSFCPYCEGVVYRQITDKADDPYYDKSRKIAVMRAEFEKDTLQPGQYGFETMYGRAFEDWESGREERERRIRARYAAVGLTGVSLAERDEVERLREEFEGR